MAKACPSLVPPQVPVPVELKGETFAIRGKLVGIEPTTRRRFWWEATVEVGGPEANVYNLHNFSGRDVVLRAGDLVRPAAIRGFTVIFNGKTGIAEVWKQYLICTWDERAFEEGK